jgi:hypothetical protein
MSTSSSRIRRAIWTGMRGLDVVEAVEGLQHAGADPAVGRRSTEGDGDGLEARLVVALENDADHQVPDRVLAQIGRDIGQPDAVVVIELALPHRA